MAYVAGTKIDIIKSALTNGLNVSVEILYTNMTTLKLRAISVSEFNNVELSYKGKSIFMADYDIISITIS